MTSSLPYQMEVEVPPSLVEQFVHAKAALESFSKTQARLPQEWERDFPHYKSFVSYLIDHVGRLATKAEVSGDAATGRFVIGVDNMSQAAYMCALEMIGPQGPFISFKYIKAPGFAPA